MRCLFRATEGLPEYWSSIARRTEAMGLAKEVGANLHETTCIARAGCRRSVIVCGIKLDAHSSE